MSGALKDDVEDLEEFELLESRPPGMTDKELAQIGKSLECVARCSRKLHAIVACTLANSGKMHNCASMTFLLWLTNRKQREHTRAASNLSSQF